MLGSKKPADTDDLFFKRSQTHFLLGFVLGAMHVGKCVRSEDGAHGGGPLGRHKPVLPQQDVPNVLRTGHTHRGVPKKMRAVDVPVLLPLHPQKPSPLQSVEHGQTHRLQFKKGKRKITRKTQSPQKKGFFFQFINNE